MASFSGGLRKSCKQWNRLREFRRIFLTACTSSYAVRDFADLPRDGAWVVSTCLLAQVCAYLKDSCRAGALYEILLPFAGRNIVIGSAAAFYGPVARHLGLLATTMLQWDEAAGHFEGSLASCQRMGARPFEAYTQHEYGAMLLARGREEDRARAKQMFNRARATARELGMAKLIADIQSLTRSAASEFQS
jgi:hypothetical protein